VKISTLKLRCTNGVDLMRMSKIKKYTYGKIDGTSNTYLTYVYAKDTWSYMKKDCYYVHIQDT
jgi:hypothetical protein